MIRSVEQFISMQAAYRQAGIPFTPACPAGSPAAAMVIAAARTMRPAAVPPKVEKVEAKEQFKPRRTRTRGTEKKKRDMLIVQQVMEFGRSHESVAKDFKIEPTTVQKIVSESVK